MAAGAMRMKIACVLTVKNEEGMLLDNIRYHHHLGITHFFVFLDHSTDRSKETVEHRSDVTVFENLTLTDLLPYNSGKDELDVALLVKKFAEHNGIRQVLHANMALELCRENDIDWLVSLDPDELICLDPLKAEKRGLLKYLDATPDEVGAIRFLNVEVVPTSMTQHQPFEDTLFKNRVEPRELATLPKSTLPDPYKNERVPAGWFWGHTSGKLAVRTHPEAYFTVLTSKFHTPGEKRDAETLLHYNILSFPHFVWKYRNFRNFPEFTSLGRRVRPLRTLFVDLVNDPTLTAAELSSYFQNHVLYTSDDIAAIRAADANAFVDIRAVADFFAER